MLKKTDFLLNPSQQYLCTSNYNNDAIYNVTKHSM